MEMLLYVPGLVTNLSSIGAVTDSGISVHFVEFDVTFNRNYAKGMIGRRIGRILYHLHVSVNPVYESAYLVPSPAP